MLKRPHYIALGLIVLFTLVLLNLPAQTTARLKLGLGSIFLPLFGLSGSTREVVTQGLDALITKRELLRQRDMLLRENQQLRLTLQTFETLEEENNRLRQLVAWRQKQRWNLRLARVVARDPANWWRTVQIDVGSLQGVKENMPVLTPDGLVGRISQVSPGQSQVVLVGDPNCKVAVRVENPARDAGIIGPGGPLDRELVELSYLSRDAQLEAGQLVRSSGDGGIFPKGIVVGTILDSHPVEYGLYTVARVRLSANLNGLEEVWVLLEEASNTGGGARE